MCFISTLEKRLIKILFRLQQDANGRPLVVILSYLLAKKKHIAKYAEVYFKQGFDVLVTRNTSMQTFWPKRTIVGWINIWIWYKRFNNKIFQVVAEDIVKFLDNNDYYDQMVIHGFSVGDFIWTQCQLVMMREPALQDKILYRIKGQIWDSMIHFDEIPIGLSQALFPNNEFLRKSLQRYIELHMKIFYKPVTSYFVQAHNLLTNNILKAPALMIVSKVDPIGTAKANEITREIWRSLGIDVTWKCFEASNHVCHFVKYREEYTELMVKHLDSLKLQKAV